MDESEIFKVGEKSYVNPQKGVDETNAFVENLRNTATTENQNIENQTHAMGSDLPSSHGGLSGSGDVWTAQYQTPVLNTTVEGLKATAQSEALNTAMSNYQAYLQDQYNQAYRNYVARQKAKSSSSSSSGTDDTVNGGVNATATDQTTAISVDFPQYTTAAEENAALNNAIHQETVENATQGSVGNTTTSGIDWNSYLNVLR